MHVGIIAPLWWPIVPDRGGIEQIVHLQVLALRERGDRVTLFATGDSMAADRLIAVHAEGLAPAMDAGRAWDYAPYEHALVGQVLRHAREVEILHSHCGTTFVPFADLLPVPIVHTLHTSISGDMRWVLRTFPGATMTTVSRWQADALEEAAQASVIMNGIDLDAFPFSRDADDYVLVLGRVEPRKGVDVAIEAARAAGLPLVIAGGVVDRDYFATEVAPHLDDRRVRYVGRVAGAAKVRLLQRARALLFPIRWEEAFGLVMVEAMACGTPVAALARGAVPEVVMPGVNGFHTTEPSSLGELIARCAALDRRLVRQSVAGFSHRRMADEYAELYRRLLAAARD